MNHLNVQAIYLHKMKLVKLLVSGDHHVLVNPPPLFPES